MNIAIVDDNINDTQILCEYIRNYFVSSAVLPVLNTFTSGEDFLESGVYHSCDVVFLDIFMDKLTGIQVARKLREHNAHCAIVFDSTSNNFASESYEVGALQYLIKPYSYEKFASVMSKINNDKSKCGVCYFALKQKGEDSRIATSKIIFVDYHNHYVQIHTSDGVTKSYIVTFQQVADALTKLPQFIWCYRNVLINMDKVNKIEDKYFIMCDGNELPINRDKIKEIKQRYNSYLFKKIEGDNQ